MSEKPKRETITELFTRFSGQANTLTIPRPYIDFCQGDHLAALVLNQILYWADRTDDPDEWFAKSYDDWYAELCLTDYQIKRAIKGDKRRKNGGFSLETVGIETKLAQSKFYHGAATLHYRVDYEKLTAAITAHFSDLTITTGSTKPVSDNVQIEGKADPDIVQIAIPTLLGSLPPQCSERSTKTIQKTTLQKDSNASNDALDAPTQPQLIPDSQPPKPPTDHQQMFQAICKALDLDPTFLTDDRKGTIGKTASQIRKAHGTPAQIPKFMRWLRERAQEKGWDDLTENAMRKYWGTYASEIAPKPPIYVDLSNSPQTMGEQYEKTMAAYNSGRFDEAIKAIVSEYEAQKPDKAA